MAYCMLRFADAAIPASQFHSKNFADLSVVVAADPI